MANHLTTRPTHLPKPTYKLVKNMDLVLADLSGSMAGAIKGATTKYDCLKSALAAQGERIGIIGFGYHYDTMESVFETNALELPPPSGGTPLTQAFDHALTLDPMHILVISDGQPNSKDTAIESAAKLANDVIIDVLYIGPRDDTQATSFMCHLAEIGRGRYVEYDLVAEGAASPLALTTKVSALLALPAPKTIQL